MLVNHTYTELKDAQLHYLDSETFNFLVELRLVSLGSYQSMVNMFKGDTKAGIDFMKQCIRYWHSTLGGAKPNVFQIAYCARKGYLD